ncbi:MAG TPA: universal stress protein [Noviherbaspirillum sp.]|jgi:nucleotide-binding universal stress UspA family protein|uniref:universal stress protein n=1 Tax=Noviherbaspirillum sp. TaxID=1926288 RepID=UPI002DDD4411|nr:universal stress protein [Noviherbaspirillum sp.]HEV2609829.1 universal stress protein [Noviherbaspirillum sp.]
MFNVILVPTDGSALSEKAVRGAIGIARLTKGRIVAVAVAEPYPFAPLSQGTATPDQNIYEKQTRMYAQLHADRIAEIAAEAGVPCEKHVTMSFSPYEGILAAAAEHGCDAIFMASHGRKGLNRLFVGSETQKVLAHTTLPVTVFR